MHGRADELSAPEWRVLTAEGGSTPGQKQEAIVGGKLGTSIITDWTPSDMGGGE